MPPPARTKRRFLRFTFRDKGQYVQILPYEEDRSTKKPPTLCELNVEEIRTIERRLHTLDVRRRACRGAQICWDMPRAVHDDAVAALLRRPHVMQIEPIHKHVMDHTASGPIVSVTEEEARARVGDKIYDTLMPAQRDSLRMFAARGGSGLLCDEMGCGKTLQALATHRFFSAEGALLVICPSTLRANWRNEAIAHGFFEEHEIQIIDKGTIPTRDASGVVIKTDKGRPVTRPFGIRDIRRDARMIVTSYGLVSRLPKIPCRVMVLDESHKVKNPTADVSKSIYSTYVQRAAKNQPAVLCMSGTPMSRPADMFTQIKLVQKELMPGPIFPWNGRLGLNEFSFGYRYCHPERAYVGSGRGHVWQYRGADRLQELNSFLECTVMMRRTKEQMMRDMPEKYREPVVVGEGSKNDYQKALKEVDRIREKRGNLRADRDFMEMVRDTKEKKIPKVRNYMRDVLTDELKESVGDENPPKVLIFAHHLDMLDVISEELVRAEIGHVRIDGSVPVNKRQPLVDTFQTDPTCRAAVLSLQAASAGLNMYRATVVIFAEMSWNPDTHMQAEDRAHRKGQENDVYVRYLMMLNSTDQILWGMVDKKFRNARITLDGVDERIKIKRARQEENDDDDEQPPSEDDEWPDDNVVTHKKLKTK